MIDRGWTVREAMRSAGGVRVGRELRALLEAAGFERCEASATGHAEGTADAVARLGWFEASWFAAPQVVAYVAELGIADPDEMAAIAGAWTRWATHPGALAARFWITAIGWAPAW